MQIFASQLRRTYGKFVYIVAFCGLFKISGGAAHDEMAIQTADFLLDCCPAFLRIDPREKHVETQLGDLPIVLRDRRQRRTGEAAERMVVVTGDAKITAFLAPDMPPPFESRGDNAEGQTIIGAKNRARRKPAAIQNPACLLIAQFLEIPVLCSDGKHDGFDPSRSMVSI